MPEISEHSEKHQSAFPPYSDPETIRRACYFTAVAKHLRLIGIHNPAEPFALTLEPFSVLAPQEEAAHLAKLGFPESVAESFPAAGLRLVSLPLLASYFPESEYATALHQHGLEDPFYLLDPYYGFIFWREGDRIRNRGFANNAYFAQAAKLPSELAKQKLQHPMSSLTEGVEMGKFLFPSLSKEVRTAYRANEVAEVTVRDLAEYDKLVRTLGELCQKAPRIQLWYRGQNRDYLMPDRSALALQGITPYCDVRDSALIPSLYRLIDQHCGSLEAYRDFLCAVAWWQTWASMILPPPYVERSPEAADPGEDAGDDPGFSVRRQVTDAEGRVVSEVIRDFNPALHAQRCALLANLYGCPSAWMDVTRDANVALWFSLHRVQFDAGRLSWRPLQTDNAAAPESWPTIYVFAIAPGFCALIDPETLWPENAPLRAARQKLGLLGCAGNLARNYIARHLTLKIRVAPSVKLANPPPPEFYFPPAPEDPWLAKILELQANVLAPGAAARQVQANARLFPVTEVKPGLVW